MPLKPKVKRKVKKVVREVKKVVKKGFDYAMKHSPFNPTNVKKNMGKKGR